jgi:hypothetical protein
MRHELRCAAMKCYPQSPADATGSAPSGKLVRLQASRASGDYGRTARRLCAQDGRQEDERSDTLGRSVQDRRRRRGGRHGREFGGRAAGEDARLVRARATRSSTRVVCVPCRRGVSGEFARRRRQRPRTRAQSEVCPARSCERHEPKRYQRTQQERGHQQPRQPPAGTQLGKCSGHSLSLLPGKSVDIGQRTLRSVISVVTSLHVVAAPACQRVRPPRSGGATVAWCVRVIAVNAWWR